MLAVVALSAQRGDAADDLAAQAQGPSVLLNEVLASNSRINQDPQGHFDDWIELYNAGDVLINIAGMYLTNDSTMPTKWRIPADRPVFTTIAPHGYLLIWADGDTTALGLHAAFPLSAEGDQLALFAADGRTLIDSVEFGPQTPNVSYGRDPTSGNEWRFFNTPTPARLNVGAYLGVVADLKFSYERGFYTQPLAVQITTTTPGASIFYTVDGTSPLDTQRGVPAGRPYTGPIAITTTTSLRAVATKAGWMSTRVDTHTYFFLNDVVTQATNPQTKAQVTPTGYPTSWGAVTGDYQMDPDVVGPNKTDIFGGLYAKTIQDDLRAAPTICLVMSKDDWFGSQGIYINESQDGTERVASFEFLHPGTGVTIQANCALAMQGGVTGGGTSLDRWKTYKLSMRPRFKPQTDDGKLTGGPSKLEFKLFPDSPVEQINTFVLDGVLNHGWNHPGSDQRDAAIFFQDQYVADLHNAMGGYSPHGFHAHVYLNNLYWGMYYIHERPDHAWAAEVFGGDESEYDALKHNGGGIINSGSGGNATANFNAMLSTANAVGADPANLAKYQALCNLLDVDEFITYLLANYYTGNHDWPAKNWYATHRNTPDGRWRFHSWDAEHTLEGDNTIGKSPADIHAKLAGNAEYRLRFADLVRRHFFHDGPLTPSGAAAVFKARMNQIDRAIVGESARWGDNRQTRPYTRQDWLNTQNAKLANFFPTRTNQVLGWLKSANLYPSVEAPEFSVNGQVQHGGHLNARHPLSMTPAATIWYTLDGTDPRIPGTAPDTGRLVSLVPESAAKRVLVPTAPVSDAWRTNPAFDDTAWLSGSGGVGYERSSGYQTLFKMDVGSRMYAKATSCYIRIPFEVAADDITGPNLPAAEGPLRRRFRRVSQWRRGPAGPVQWDASVELGGTGGSSGRRCPELGDVRSEQPSQQSSRGHEPAGDPRHERRRHQLGLPALGRVVRRQGSDGQRLCQQRFSHRPAVHRPYHAVPEYPGEGSCPLRLDLERLERGNLRGRAGGRGRAGQRIDVSSARHRQPQRPEHRVHRANQRQPTRASTSTWSGSPTGSTTLFPASSCRLRATA